MRKYLFVFIGALWTLTSCAQQKSDTINGTNETAKTIAEKIKNDKAILVDVRTSEEYKTGHLKNSKNIDFKSGNFTNEINKLDKSKPIYLYCRSGNRSGKALDTLQSLGFQVYHNIGGLEDLKKAGFEEE